MHRWGFGGKQDRVSSGDLRWQHTFHLQVVDLKLRCSWISIDIQNEGIDVRVRKIHGAPKAGSQNSFFAFQPDSHVPDN
jgi:hypothetical protein